MKQVFQGTFSEIRHIHINIYHQPSIEPKYGEFLSDKEASNQTLSLAFWREKVLSYREVLFFRNLTNTNQTIPSNLYLAKI